jgi:hypothetical protein
MPRVGSQVGSADRRGASPEPEPERQDRMAATNEFRQSSNTGMLFTSGGLRPFGRARLSGRREVAVSDKAEKANKSGIGQSSDAASRRSGARRLASWAVFSRCSGCDSMGRDPRKRGPDSPGEFGPAPAGAGVDDLHPAPSTRFDSYSDFAAASHAASDGNERSKLNALPSRLV